MRRVDLLLLGVVLVVLGPFLTALAIPRVNQWTCYPDPCIGNPNYTPWGYPVEIAGLALTALGITLVVLFVLVSRKAAKSAKNQS